MAKKVGSKTENFGKEKSENGLREIVPIDSAAKFSIYKELVQKKIRII